MRRITPGKLRPHAQVFKPASIPKVKDAHSGSYGLWEVVVDSKALEGELWREAVRSWQPPAFPSAPTLCLF